MAIVKQRPLDEALSHDLHEKINIALGGSRAQGDVMKPFNRRLNHRDLLVLTPWTSHTVHGDH